MSTEPRRATKEVSSVDYANIVATLAVLLTGALGGASLRYTRRKDRLDTAEAAERLRLAREAELQTVREAGRQEGLQEARSDQRISELEETVRQLRNGGGQQ